MVQIQTATDWYPSNIIEKFITFHFGYFNYHIEHHLFPTLKPNLFKKLQPIVRNHCQKYNISYVETSFYQLLLSQMGYLKKMGQEVY